MKKATLQDALAARPCYDAEQIKALFGKRKTLSVKQIAALDIPDAHKVWALTRSHFLDTGEKAVRFAVFCAEQCLMHYETRFPDDKRPRAAIDAAKAWLISPTTDAAADAATRAAADAAADATRAAWAATRAAWAATRAAADAAWAAWAAADAATRAAWAATRAAWAATRAVWAATDAATRAAWAADATRAAADATRAAADAIRAADATRAEQIKFLVKLLTEVK